MNSQKFKYKISEMKISQDRLVFNSRIMSQLECILIEIIQAEANRKI